VLGIPNSDLRLWNLDKLVRDGTILILDNGLSELVTLVLRDQIDPNIVVYHAGGNPEFY
jgi:hypothetical protein